ncbi:uncharacterized protein LOC144088725 isoform X2 [Stigmatopora argus]
MRCCFLSAVGRKGHIITWGSSVKKDVSLFAGDKIHRLAMMMQNGDQYGFVAPAYPGPPMNNLDQVNPGIVYQQPMTPAIGGLNVFCLK